MNNIILVGMPGSGKSTIGKLLADELECVYVSTGDIARSIAREDTITQNLLNTGKMAPEVEMRRRLEARLDDITQQSKCFILDGFPRNMDQAEWLHERFPACLIVYIDVDTKTCINRALARHREDDTHNALSHRIKYYTENTEPMICKLPKFVVNGDIPIHKMVQIIAYRHRMKFKQPRNQYWR